MKKILSLLVIFTCLSSLSFADAYITQDDTQDFRIELGITGFANSNLFNNCVGADEAIKFSTFNNKIGIIGGVREHVSFISDKNARPAFLVVPFVGVDLWNVDALVGFNLYGDSDDESNMPICLAHLGYNWHIIEPGESTINNALSLRFGATWYVAPILNPATNIEDAVADFVTLLFSAIIPRLEFGVTYRLGADFSF